MVENLGKSFKCSCGKVHTLPIKKIIVEEGALQKVPDLISRLTDEEKIFLIADKNTYHAAGHDLYILLQERYKVKTIILEDDKVIPDPDTIFTVLEQINREGYIIACGSGTLNDLTRYISFKLEKPYLIVATAPSMDGYASSVAPLTIKGVKKTFSAVPPEAIVADISVLQNAPWEMIQAGFGDLLGKATSLLDWQLANLLLDEYICNKSINLVKRELDKMVEIAHDLKLRTKKSIEVLINGLINSGLAMLMVGSSRPASGCEHHISHFIDMYSHMYNEEVPPHGIKVGLGTYFTSSIYLRLREMDFSEFNYRDKKEDRVQKIKDGYQSSAKTILKTLEERWEKEKLDITKLKKKEGEIKDLISNYAKYLEKIKPLLREVGIFERKDVHSLKKSWLKSALKYGFEIRERYTVVTLLSQLGYLDSWSDELINSLAETLD
ncbi:MAG: glycerol-phosphate dehydrogenase [Halanaerobiales bacterium]|nr:glycerol-phosphate dehydrogenase [Halanaerobiales bacterium]